MDASGCCPEAECLEAEAEACAAGALDPTLEACCQRDLEQQAVIARLKAQLTVHDRSKERLRAAGRVFGAGPAPAPPTAQPDSELGSELEEDEEEDEVVGRLRVERLRQLQQDAERKARLQQQGHGSVADVAEAQLLREVETCAVPAVVCHLAFDGSPLDDELDEHLATLAHQYLGTRFCRTAINLRSTLHLRLRTPPGPGLLCFRSGSLVGAAGLDRFGAPDCILEEAVNKWLRQHKVLLLLAAAANAVTAPVQQQQRSLAGGADSGGEGGDSGSSDSDSGDSGDEDEWQQPCEVCGRRYPHQHIRSVYATKGGDSDSE